MLLTEYRPFQVNQQLVEASIRDSRPLVVTGVIQRAEAKNQNGRIYPREILEREIEKIINHNFRLKTELDMNSGTFMKSTNKRIHELGAQLKRLENKLREFSN